MSSFGDGDRYDPYAGGFTREPWPGPDSEPGDGPEGEEEHAPRHRRGSKALVAAMIGTLALIVVGAVAFAGSLLMSRTSGDNSPAGKSDVAAAASVEPSNPVDGAGSPSGDPVENATASATPGGPTGAPTPTPKATTPGARPKTTPPAPAGGSNVAFENQVLALVNTERAKAGCKPVAYNAKLRAAAYKHSADMAGRNYFSHTTPEGVEFATRISNEGYRWSGAGENIAAGQSTPASVMDAWMHSDGHRANILNCKFTDLGVGLAYQVTNGRNGTPYWTQDFATPMR